VARRTVVASALVVAALVTSGCADPLTFRATSTSTALPISATHSASPTPSTSISSAPSEEPTYAPSVGASPPSSEPGLVPVLHRIDTTDKVVFVTIDDGYTKDPEVVDLLARRHVPVTSFLAVTALQSNHEYFAQVQDVTGQSVQDHTVTHPFLSRYGYERQRREICDAADQLGTWYGTRPWLFRPPYGDYSRTTRRAAYDCGMTALVLWDVSLPHSVLRFASGTRFQPGDILLVHWRPHLARDLPVALDAIEAAGLHVAALQDYLPQPS
jgi:peptidoglycan/xylan/chitin deacetylase (PgdA/CDA1 family)